MSRSKKHLGDFHAQHSPLGAFSSFTVGLPGSPGGFGHALSGPANQNVYVGYRKSSRSKWNFLPFFAPPESNESAFTGEEATTAVPSDIKVLEGAGLRRKLGWASDTWNNKDETFGFSLLSPFGPVGDPGRMKRSEKRKHFSPHINGWIEYDNRDGKSDVELLFGLGEEERLFRPVQDKDPSLFGFAINRGCGYATLPSEHVTARQGFNVLDPKFQDRRGLHVVGGQTALVFNVPAGRKMKFPLVLGFFEQGVITDGIECCYAYTELFKDLEDVLRHGLYSRKQYETLAAKRDRELERSKLTEDQQFLLAQSTHSYLGSTQLLWRQNAPLWVVNEGEYRMMNTFDLTVDHLFFELKYFPWAVRNVLDLFLSRYSYRDRIYDGNGTEASGGISFTHDMGVMNHFTPKGQSSYECDNLTGCFSHMTMEQLLNWVLTAVCYAEKTGDQKWLKANEKTLRACVRSMQRRDHPVSAKRDGILKFDTMRCKRGGAEITTYDSLDISLGQARNNLYLAVKTLGAWILLESAFGKLGNDKAERTAAKTANLLANSISEKFDADTKTFPAVFENDNKSLIIPAIEGFVYPLFLGISSAVDRQGRFSTLLGQLSEHMNQVLKPGVCLDAASGGWKISSTSTNTWFSKIALSQFVVRNLFPEVVNASVARADQVHADWQRSSGCGAYAMCDQIRSDTGEACGSRYYPRGVTSILWIDE